MNEYDWELVRAILDNGSFRMTPSLDDADVVLLNTCAIRESAHDRIHGRLGHLHQLKKRTPRLIVGVLGCMAQNLKQELLDRHPVVDLVAGPDAYKRLPRLIHSVCDSGQKGLDIDLSEYETYSDIAPARVPGVNAWIACMRGCDNFCTFCVLPYTRGRERSRAPESVVEEARRLAAQGYKQVTLLGLNVNSYGKTRGRKACGRAICACSPSLPQRSGVSSRSSRRSSPSSATFFCKPNRSVVRTRSIRPSWWCFRRLMGRVRPQPRWLTRCRRASSSTSSTVG